MEPKERWIAILLLIATALIPLWYLRLLTAAAAILVLVFSSFTRQKPEYKEQVQDFGPRFSRFRHDLLNDLQLVYGFVQLNKPMQDTLARVDRVIARIRTAGLMFNIQNWEFSCWLFDLWEEAESAGVKINLQTSGNWTGFHEQWSAWANGLKAVWAYYKGLAEATGLSEVDLTLAEGEFGWQVRFAALGAPVTASSLPKRLNIDLGSGANLSWNHAEHSITVQVDKP